MIENNMLILLYIILTICLPILNFLSYLEQGESR